MILRTCASPLVCCPAADAQYCSSILFFKMRELMCNTKRPILHLQCQKGIFLLCASFPLHNLCGCRALKIYWKGERSKVSLQQVLCWPVLVLNKKTAKPVGAFMDILWCYNNPTSTSCLVVETVLGAVKRKDQVM